MLELTSDARTTLGSRLIAKGEPGWDEARLPWNRIVEQRPEAVVTAMSTADVAAALRFARDSGLKVAVQSSGHGAGESLGELTGALLVDMSRLRSVEIDPQLQIARVGPGATWEEVQAAGAPHGLAGLSGSSPNVAVAGYCLGGGAGYLGRRYGLAANNVVSIDVVLPDGTAVRVDREHEPDLFWALRGGGGSFAVVTGLELQLFPVSTVYAGFMFWPIERAASVLQAWIAWAAAAPREVTSVGRLFQFPPIADIPEPFRGRSLVGVTAAILADERAGTELIRPLRELKPEFDTFAEVPAPAITRIHLDPEDPVPAVADGYVVRDFDGEALDVLLAAVPPRRESSLLLTEIRHLGGAFSERRPDHGSAGTLGGEHIVFGVGLALSPEMTRAGEQDLDEIAAAVGPWLAPRQYMNLADRPRPAEDLFPADDLARLREIRRRYDPEGVLLSNRPL